MPIEKTYGFCRHCNKRTEIYRKSCNHVVHAILSLFTLGIWLIVWIGSAIRFGGWKCTACGSSKVKVD